MDKETRSNLNIADSSTICFLNSWSEFNNHWTINNQPVISKLDRNHRIINWQIYSTRLEWNLCIAAMVWWFPFLFRSMIMCVLMCECLVWPLISGLDGRSIFVWLIDSEGISDLRGLAPILKVLPHCGFQLSE